MGGQAPPAEVRYSGRGLVSESMRTAVTVFSKEGCHQCETVVETLNSLRLRYDLEVRVVDINDDPGLHDKYWLNVPAVQFNGKDVFDARDMGGEETYAVTLEGLLRSHGSAPVSA